MGCGQGEVDEGGIVDVIGQSEVVQVLHEQAVGEVARGFCGVKVIGRSSVFVLVVGIEGGNFFVQRGEEFSGGEALENEEGGGDGEQVVILPFVVPERCGSLGPGERVGKEFLFYF